MLAAIAWRNVWRNSRRSLITMTALSLGVAGLVGIHSYREVINAVIIRDITAGLVGHLQIHAKGYQEAPAVGLVVPHPQQVEATLAHAVPGAKSERRVLGAGLAGAGDRSSPAMVLGVDVGVSGLYRVTAGAAPAAHQVLVGQDLAKELELSPGGELVLVGQAADGSVANDRFTVSGTFGSSSAELDSTAVVLPLADAQAFFGLDDGVNQLVVRLPYEHEDVGPEVGAVRTALDGATLEALGWNELLPQLKASIESKRGNQRLMDFVVFLIVGLGVFNAMTMAVFERTRELGVLASLGTRPSRLLAMVVLEALWQGVLAFTVGVALAALVLFAVGTVDLSAMFQGDVMGARMPSAVTLRLDPRALTGAAITAFSTALLGALIPAIRAARLVPVEALRHA